MPIASPASARETIDRFHGNALECCRRGEDECRHPGGRLLPRNGVEASLRQRRANGRVEGRRRQHRQGQAGGRDAPALQPRAQGGPAFLQSPLQRAERPAELFGGFVAGQAGQVAQQERRPQALRQALQFLVEGGSHLAPGQVGFRPWSPCIGSGTFSIGTARRFRARAAMRHVAVYSQFGTDCPAANRSWPAGPGSGTRPERRRRRRRRCGPGGGPCRAPSARGGRAGSRRPDGRSPR